jgi:hypothetical protein
VFVSLGHNQLTDHHALRAVVMVTDNLVHTMERPNDMPGRIFMAQAALEAVLAFTNAVLGAAHAMSHQVGACATATRNAQVHEGRGSHQTTRRPVGRPGVRQSKARSQVFPKVDVVLGWCPGCPGRSRCG